jgi:hypothetical protein
VPQPKRPNTAQSRSAQQKKRSPQPKRPAARHTPAPQPSVRSVETRKQITGSAGRGAARRHAARRLPWYRGPIPLIGAVVAMIAIIAVFVSLANRPNKAIAGIGDPVAADVLAKVTHVSPTVSQAVGTGGLPNPYRALHGQAPLQGSDGKPQVLYVGADYCPYCAAARWSMVVALSRFGTFSDLHYMASSASDIYPNTSTFTFYKSSYTSQYIDLAAIENEDRQQQPQQALTSQQQQLFSAIGSNGYPFLDIANQYANGASTFASGYDPAVLQGLSWQQIAAKLSNANDPVTQAIVGDANYLTAAICKATNDQPGSVCGASTIHQIEQQLPKGS